MGDTSRDRGNRALPLPSSFFHARRKGGRPISSSSCPGDFLMRALTTHPPTPSSYLRCTGEEEEEEEEDLSSRNNASREISISRFERWDDDSSRVSSLNCAAIVLIFDHPTLRIESFYLPRTKSKMANRKVFRFVSRDGIFVWRFGIGNNWLLTKSLCEPVMGKVNHRIICNVKQSIQVIWKNVDNKPRINVTLFKIIN